MCHYVVDKELVEETLRADGRPQVVQETACGLDTWSLGTKNTELVTCKECQRIMTRNSTVDTIKEPIK